MKPVDVVIPVYAGFDETRRCLDTVLATIDSDWVRIVVVNDCSPEPEITGLLRDLAGRFEQLVLLENDENLGFVATANRGMQHDAGRDVLLLNSDVEVPAGLLERMRAAAYASERIGSLTPFSNNATVCSFPNFCKDNSLPWGVGLEAIDHCFEELAGAEDVYEVPSGVGFCMFIRRDCLDSVGYFDVETFGRGYGEENDWCQRAIAAGWSNGHLGNCFVYHKGGVSFGEEYSPRVARALERLDRKYPSYHADVQTYIASDPARRLRTLVLFQLFARQSAPKLLFITHKLGGGSQQHVDELAALYAGRAMCLQLTPVEDGRSVALSVFDNGSRLQDGLYFDVEREYDTLRAVLIGLAVGSVHFHHTMGLHPRIWRLADDLGCEYDLTVHDYYLLNGNPTLTDASARFVEETAADFDARCAGHYPLPDGVTADAWRESQRLLVEGAARVIFPSADCARRFQRFFDVATPVVAWHPDYRLSQPYPRPEWRRGSERPLRVLVIGAISREKGADLLESVAVSLSAAAIDFHLLGYAYRALDARVITHGPYENADVYHLVGEIDPDVVWFPALWPETYSYTLSIALHMGLPVVAPDIGAFVERVADRAMSTISPWNRSPDDWVEFWRRVERENTVPDPIDLPDGVPAAKPGLDFYDLDYLQRVAPLSGELSPGLLTDLAGNLHDGLPQLTGRERVLERLWRASRTPLVARLIGLVPFRVQRALKRRLSARPMHDIVRGE